MPNRKDLIPADRVEQQQDVFERSLSPQAARRKAKPIAKKPPAEPRLTAKQRAVVHMIVDQGTTQEATATALGMTQQSVSRMLSYPHVREYMQRYTVEAMTLRGVRALHSIDNLAHNARSEYVKLQAGQDMADRAGLRAAEKHLHRIEGDLKVEIDLS